MTIRQHTGPARSEPDPSTCTTTRPTGHPHRVSVITPTPRRPGGAIAIQRNTGIHAPDVLKGGLRFDEFFRNFGVLEDAHRSLRAHRDHRVVEVGRARAVHLDSPPAREHPRLVAWKTAVTVRFVFVDIVPNRTVHDELRLWRARIRTPSDGRRLIDALRPDEPPSRAPAENRV